jgi:hypothetical protein
VRRENKVEIFCHKFLVLKKKLPKNSRVCFFGEKCCHILISGQFVTTFLLLINAKCIFGCLLPAAT